MIGYHAGFAGAALALKTWAWQLQHPDTPLPSVDHFTDSRGYYLNEKEMVDQIREDVIRGEKIAGHKPRVLVIGALGRCGRFVSSLNMANSQCHVTNRRENRGAVDACVKAGCEDVLRWDMAETAKGGPFQEIVESDMSVPRSAERSHLNTNNI